MSEIKVSFGALDAAALDVTNAAGHMNERLDSLRRYLAPMVATWDGGAAAEYTVMQRQWDTAAAQMNDVLTRIGVALVNARDGYQQAETVNRNRW